MFLLAPLLTQIITSVIPENDYDDERVVRGLWRVKEKNKQTVLIGSADVTQPCKNASLCNLVKQEVKRVSSDVHRGVGTCGHVLKKHIYCKY